MQRIKILSLMAAILVLSGCSQQQTDNKDAIANPATDPVGNAGDMIKLKNNMEKNIQDSTDKENANRNEALDAGDTGKGQDVTGDNSSLVQKYPFALIKTNQGNIKVKFHGADAPLTVGNFLKLAKSGFYKDVKFHRVIKDFMIQGGDPLSKGTDVSLWGTGGPGYKFKDELKGTEKYPQGTLAMANSGPDTNGSQFFIVTQSPGAPLPPSYTVFGEVVSGLDVALKIQNVTIGTNNRPVDPVIITGVDVLEK